MTASSFHTVVEELVGRSAEELLRSVGVRAQLERAAPSPKLTDRHVAGLVRFTGDVLNGSLALVASFDAFAQSRPRSLKTAELSTGRAADWLVVRDWAGELTNQLMGRVKNRLDLPLAITVPVALDAGMVVVATRATSSHSRVRSFVFGKGDDAFDVKIAYIADPSVVISGREVAREGDVLLF